VEFDYTEEVVEELGLPIQAVSSGGATGPDDMRWDCSIAGLKFLFAMNSNEYRFKRETAQFRRERIDTERDPGEQSLDSGLWIRSQASWHYGAGIRTAEPLEVNSQEARFRYFQSGGVDPWATGFLRLHNSASSIYSASATDFFLEGIDTGVLVVENTTSSNALLTYVQNNGTSASVNWGGTGLIHSITDSGQYWFVSNAAGIWRGDLPGGSGTKIYNNKGGTTRSLLKWVKSRLMYADQEALHEITNLTPSSATLPTALFTHPNSGWEWTGFADGPAAIYASGYSLESSAIYRIGINVTTTTVTLNQPVVVAEMPRGENVLSITSYVGSFLIIGTNRGLRVADIQGDGSLQVGPLIWSEGPVEDSIPFGEFVYFTVRRKGRAGDRTDAPGLYRVNLGQPLEDDALRFAHAADLYAFGIPAGETKAVTISDNKLWFTVNGTAAGAGVYKQSSEFVSEGWLETGRIRLGTIEKKAWRDLRLLAAPAVTGSITAYASITGLGAPSTWTQIVTATLDNPDQVGSLAGVSPFTSTDLFLAFRLRSNAACQCSASMIGYQVRAVPSPRRNELIEVPVMMYDWEVDRTGARYGSKGNSYARFRALKDLEQSGRLIQWRDFTTGEAAEGYVEAVLFHRMTPPTSGFQGAGAGGVCRVVIRIV
jgi:hypothetical protein